MDPLEYAKLQRLHEERRFSLRAKWLIVGVVVIACFSLWVLANRYQLLEYGAEGASTVGMTEFSAILDRSSERERMKEDAEALHGCDVVWIELPRSSFSAFSTLMLDKIPSGTSLSFLTLEDDQFGAYVPEHDERSIMNQLRDSKSK